MRWKRVVAGTSIISFFLLASLLVLMDSCLQFRMTDREIDSFFAAKERKGVIESYYVGKQKMNYVKVGPDSLALVLFVHGSPGSLSAFIDFLADDQLLAKAQLISVDRPGFGASNFGYAEPSIEKQAAELKPILEQHRYQRPIILVGHSLGGPVIARMAMDFPDLVDGMIFVAASIDPDLEPNEWFRGPLATPFLKWILPRSFRASNDEIYQLKPQLQAMTPMWPKIKAPTIVIQGQKDELVHPGNADFAKRMMTNATLTFVTDADMGHFVPWTHPQLIREAILELISAGAASSVR